MMKVKHLLVSLMMCGTLVAGHASAEYTIQNSIFSADRTAERIKADAKICVEGDACGTAAAGGGAAAKKTPDEIYNTSCAGCHMTGAAGAPKTGDKAGWTARIAQGNDTLYKHAIGGFNAMPPKGTCGDCSDDDIKAVVDLMVSQSK